MPNVPGASTPGAAEASKSPRGALVKAIGQPAGITPPGGGQPYTTFEVDKITVDGKCTASFAKQPENGHFVILEMWAETTPEAPSNAFFWINARDWTVVGPDGVTESALGTLAAFSCLNQAEELPNRPYAPGSKYRGGMVLDTRNTSGVLVYRPRQLSTGGWEWAFPT